MFGAMTSEKSGNPKLRGGGHVPRCPIAGDANAGGIALDRAPPTECASEFATVRVSDVRILCLLPAAAAAATADRRVTRSRPIQSPL